MLSVYEVPRKIDQEGDPSQEIAEWCESGLSFLAPLAHAALDPILARCVS